MDPFAGGGAVLVEAAQAGIAAVGLDVNPLACLISRVKSRHLPAARLLRAYQALLEAYPSAIEEVPQFPSQARVEFWFKPYMMKPLAKLAWLVNQVEDPTIREVFMVVLSATVRDVSLTYRGEVRLHKLRREDSERFNPDVLAKFRERAELSIQRIATLPPEGTVQVLDGDARRIPFGAGHFGAIVTSPPYGDDRNGVGYFQFSKNMLYWLGFSEDQIKTAKQRFLGEVKAGKCVPSSATLVGVLERMRENPVPSNPNAVAECIAFYRDYQEALREMTRVCSGPIAVVIGDRTLSQTYIDNAAVTNELMSNVGWRLKEYYHRTIDKKRIPVMQPGGGQRDRSGGGLINKEHTLVYTAGT